MPKRQQFIEEINDENGYGVFLLSQMDAIPDTLQFVIATTEYDEEVDGLRDKSRYVVRALGVREHKISMGMFNKISFMEKVEHPLLYQYNTPPTAVFFRGKPDNVQELILDIFQGYASTFGNWRHIPQYLNITKNLLDLLTSDGDLLGEMPKPLAQYLEKVFQKHDLETKLIEDMQELSTHRKSTDEHEHEHEHHHEHKHAPQMKLLMLDNSFVVALDFSVEELGMA